MSDGPPQHYDPLRTMPDPIRKWAEKKGLRSLVQRYSWTFCEVCGQLGISWSTDSLPKGINLEFSTQYHGWMHPPADGMRGGYVGDFQNTWDLEREPEKLDDRDLSYYFDLFMKSLCNSWGLSISFGTEYRHAKGKTNPWDFCFSATSSFGKEKGTTRGICPKCGRPGSGEGVVKGERRFFHGPNDTCYLEMAAPKRVKRPETPCPKCGELGRESITKKGYRYFRHKKKTCYAGRFLTSPTIQRSGTVRKETPSSNETTMLYTEPSETKDGVPTI